jgi:hypothetical protein
MLKASGLAIPKAKATLVTADGVLSQEHTIIGCDEMYQLRRDGAPSGSIVSGLNKPRQSTQPTPNESR